MTTPTAPLVPKATPYLTIIPHRRPEQKVHTGLGQAKNAINARMTWRNGLACDVWLYEQSGGEWVLKWHVPEGTQRADLPWVTQ